MKETHEQILQRCAVARAKRIKELEQLWRDVTKKDLREFDKAIMKRFLTTSGRDALSDESMDLIQQGLLEKAKELTSK